MQVLVDYKLFQMLVESIDKQASLADQDADTQARWKAVINETYITAKTALAEHRKHNMVIDGRTETGQGAIVGPDKTSYL